MRTDPKRDYLRYSSLGIEFALYLCLFGWLGWWLDGWLDLRDTFPAFLIVGVFLGMGLGIYRLNRLLGPKPRGPRDGASGPNRDQES